MGKKCEYQGLPRGLNSKATNGEYQLRMDDAQLWIEIYGELQMADGSGNWRKKSKWNGWIQALSIASKVTLHARQPVKIFYPNSRLSFSKQFSPSMYKQWAKKTSMFLPGYLFPLVFRLFTINFLFLVIPLFITFFSSVLFRELGNKLANI